MNCHCEAKIGYDEERGVSTRFDDCCGCSLWPTGRRKKIRRPKESKAAKEIKEKIDERELNARGNELKASATSKDEGLGVEDG